MVSSQRPNQYQLSIAKQFVDQFPHVNLRAIDFHSTEFRRFRLSDNMESIFNRLQ
jgi:urate oxidase